MYGTCHDLFLISGVPLLVEEPSYVKQLSLNHVCKIGLKLLNKIYIFCTEVPKINWQRNDAIDRIGQAFIWAFFKCVFSYVQGDQTTWIIYKNLL